MDTQEKRAWRRRWLGCSALTAAWVTAFALPAYANQPPGPQMMLAEVLLLPLMMLFTALGGAYTLVHPPGKKRRKGWRAGLAVLAIFLSGMHEGYGLIVALAFGLLAVARGVQLVLWGVARARKGSAAEADARKLSAPRLIFSGTALVLISVALAGLSFAFLGWWPREEGIERNLRGVVAFQLHYGEQHRDAQGAPQFAVFAPDEDGQQPFENGPYSTYLTWNGSERSGNAEFKRSADGRSFQIWVWPQRMPMFPYNYLVSLPSFYADQTGQLRVIRVHHAGQRCPADAPVSARITASDWKE